ncbi:ribonuclease P protein component [Candidatus Daviesbacteria bacterium RIFCSPHIGHO2_01_FULL_44_29]|uniref:Ribonuclease P protein component n=1 Tax=Candidatus Daviesbacteria bacterium RIFCSPHIGHO2_02_FULL_43_12 TaxID=1797776 RepID=A0A1F5KH03_9BACT|nr:MAG: ribonuclease P protein component [Candidatus Daviesbacteria bacterium RIFCSPHIGHO2_01_FULL_44_29]OGE40114.1 MAG: ribonuclease P protein component [Candidatus Daviesbacteria bacterium RIFCSPHIGHO2_02_FULL_43_12]OGE41063.1 MAG: ribonuclease P protein component [Candidatus Daviesbacteria bacterium RIFCSPHIGHO2_12_FULL_47_45]OGE70204.1 MAG: ribonuclease P protein component [Candidatus Daviesbacteria bacterium RIFCSPLOWO2_01_FULL_43_15]
MLPKTKRLNLTHSFRKVASGQRLETSHLVIFFIHSPDSSPKIGIATSKKLGGSPERHRAKRLVATAFQQIYDRIKPGLLIVAMPKPSITDASSTQLEAELRSTKELMIHA